ncbi:MAG: hypothetical protein K6F82_00660 [Sphaerochaetaceae bacterium]|nr:hypothetical protein [Sphaerochaetaceae bacterium]
MKRYSVISVFLLVLIILAGCSTVAVKEAEVVPVEVAEPAATEPVAVESEEKEVYEWSHDFNGSSFKISAEEGNAVISYPSAFSAESVKALISLISSDYSILQNAEFNYETEGSVTVTGLSLEDVKDFTLFIDYQLEDYVKQYSDPSYVPLTKLTVSDSSVTYDVNTEYGVLSAVFTDENLTVSFPHDFTDEEIQSVKNYLSDNFSVVLDENNSCSFTESPALSDILVMAKAAENAVAEFAASLSVVPEVAVKQTEEVVPEVPSVPLAEAVSKALESAEQTAEVRKEEVQGTWITANPLIVILGVVGLCILLGILYYFTVHKPKIKKKK